MARPLLTTGPLLTRSAALAITASALVLGGLGINGAAASAERGQQTEPAPPVSLSITSVSPAYAQPGQTVTVSGTLTNVSSASMADLSLQLLSSGTPFDNRAVLAEYADGSDSGGEAPVGPATTLTRPLRPQTTVRWSMALPGSDLPTAGFGVYPLAAQVSNADQSVLSESRTFLPFWPGQKSQDPMRQDVAWIWPLIDQPREGMCPGLVNNGLAASFRSGGRLNGLLQAGQAYASRAHLTWAIDPALLATADTMSKAYHAGGLAGCHGPPRSPQVLPEPASRAAAAWLTGIKSATIGQPVLVTPYDDADIAALTRSGLGTDLNRAFTQGRSIAGQILGRSFSPAAAGAITSPSGPNAMAWPADGIANYADLQNLAATDGISSAVLASSTMPPSPPQNYTPAAQAATSDGSGSGMQVLLSDETITQVLGQADSPSDSPGTAFSVRQRYLAETAMIAAEQPNLARSIVIAPPRRWDPPAGLASGLLAETVSAPWLRPVSLGQLAAVQHPTGQVTRRRPRAVSRAQLSRPLLDQVRDLDQEVRLLKSIQLGPDPVLDRGIFAIESSAWRGGGQAGRQAAVLLQQVSRYLGLEQAKLRIIVSQREQLVGKTGTVPVSISNQLPYNVKVQLRVDPTGGVTIKHQPRPVVIPAGQQEIVKLGVTAAAVGSTTLSFSLLTPDGTVLPNSRATMTIQATHYGTLALVIIAAVLGLFLISSGVRTIRRRSRGGAPSSDAAPDGSAPDRSAPDGSAPADAGPAAVDPDPDQHEWRAEPDKPDTVVSDRTNHDRVATGQMTGHDPAEEPDDYAWTPGWIDRP